MRSLERVSRGDAEPSKARRNKNIELLAGVNAPRYGYDGYSLHDTYLVQCIVLDVYVRTDFLPLVVTGKSFVFWTGKRCPPTQRTC